MYRVFYLTGLLSLIPMWLIGQCSDPAWIKLSSSTGSACGIDPVIISGNTFGGGATRVSISENGKGSVSTAVATSSPFTFTYIPKKEDEGEKVVITIMSNDPAGQRCRAAKVTFTLYINAMPSSPAIETITQPTCSDPTGSIVLNNLPGSGNWTLTGNPGGFSKSGSGSSTIVSGLSAGNYNFRVTSQGGCISALSEEVSITHPPAAPTVRVTDPAVVCYPSTADITSASVINGSGPGLTYTYWRDSEATRLFQTPSAAAGGTYYIKATAANGCSDIKPVTVTVKHPPEANAGPDKILDYQFETSLDASGPVSDETGKWSVITGSGYFSDDDDPTTRVSNLAPGKNAFLWTLTTGVCPPANDTVIISVKDLVIPTMITPNMDGRNDYLVIGSKEVPMKMELTVFDRKGVQVFKDNNYANKWEGLDYNGHPLPEGTYFYMVKTGIGKSTGGYVVIRR